MKTTKGPAKKPPVEVVTDPKSGVSVTIYYDRELNDFYGYVEATQTTYRHSSGKECVKRIAAALEASRSFDWKPVITIAYHGGVYGCYRGYGAVHSYKTAGAQIQFDYWRSELAPKPGQPGQFLERPFLADVKPERLVEHEKGHDTHHHRITEKGEVVIPYTEEVWAVLAQLSEATSRLYAQLTDLFHKPELLALEATRPTFLLPAPEEKA